MSAGRRSGSPSRKARRVEARWIAAFVRPAPRVPPVGVPRRATGTSAGPVAPRAANARSSPAAARTTSTQALAASSRSARSPWSANGSKLTTDGRTRPVARRAAAWSATKRPAAGSSSPGYQPTTRTSSGPPAAVPPASLTAASRRGGGAAPCRADRLEPPVHDRWQPIWLAARAPDLGPLLVDEDDVVGLARRHDVAALEEDGVVAELAGPGHVVGHEDDRPGCLHEPHHPGLALRPERRVACAEDLVEEEDVRLDRGRDAESQPGVHPGAVRLDRGVDELAKVGEVDDPGHSRDHVGVGDAHEGAGQEDVVAAAELGIEARAEGQQARDPTVDLDRALVRQEDPGEDLEEGALAG